MISLKSLCIAPGKAAWVLYVDATCINYDGNAFDAALLAMVAALRNSESPGPVSADVWGSCVVHVARLPTATYDEERGRTVCSRKVMRSLEIGRTPTAFSFGIFDGYVPFSSLPTCCFEHTI